MTNDNTPAGTDPDAREFGQLASQLVRELLDERKVSVADLAERLAGRGLRMTAADIEAAFDRGDFSAAFLFRVMLAIGAKEIRFLP